eukprot:scaffold42140_cov661-Skeletonema_dohrnii-CCMP3373.AAC.1
MSTREDVQAFVKFTDKWRPVDVETMMKRSRNRQKRLARVLLLPLLSIAVAYYRADENNIIANKLVLCVEVSSLAYSSRSTPSSRTLSLLHGLSQLALLCS